MKRIQIREDVIIKSSLCYLSTIAMRARLLTIKLNLKLELTNFNDALWEVAINCQSLYNKTYPHYHAVPTCKCDFLNLCLNFLFGR